MPFIQGPQETPRELGIWHHCPCDAEIHQAPLKTEDPLTAPTPLPRSLARSIALSFSWSPASAAAVAATSPFLQNNGDITNWRSRRRRCGHGQSVGRLAWEAETETGEGKRRRRRRRRLRKSNIPRGVARAA